MPCPLRPVWPLVLLILSCATAKAQRDVHFRNGPVRLSKNIDSLEPVTWEARRRRVLGYSFHFVQFDHLPSGEQRARLEQAGIRLLDYIPYNTYVVSITRPGALPVLK